MDVRETVEVTEAAIRAYGRLLRAVGRRLETREWGSGGLICEDRRSLAQPRLWRILADGEVMADTRYDFRRRAFVTAALPHGV